MSKLTWFIGAFMLWCTFWAGYDLVGMATASSAETLIIFFVCALFQIGVGFCAFTRFSDLRAKDRVKS